jgi:hypothetical protein
MEYFLFLPRSQREFVLYILRTTGSKSMLLVTRPLAFRVRLNLDVYLKPLNPPIPPQPERRKRETSYETSGGRNSEKIERRTSNVEY